MARASARPAAPTTPQRRSGGPAQAGPRVLSSNIPRLWGIAPIRRKVSRRLWTPRYPQADGFVRAGQLRHPGHGRDVADHYGRFLPQDKAALATQVLNRVWEDAAGAGTPRQLLDAD